MLLHSAELRWFFGGPMPRAVSDWFHEGRVPAQPERRTDIYLWLPGCVSVGIKLRNEKFEVKAVCGAAEPIAVTEGVAGRTDRWIKWSLSGPAVPAFGGAMRGDARTIAVEKTRWQRRYSLDDETPRELGAGETRTHGCNVELSLIGAETRQAWSVGFEAYGAPDLVADHLRRTAVSFFARPSPQRFPAENSFSYPVWLSSL